MESLKERMEKFLENWDELGQQAREGDKDAQEAIKGLLELTQ